MSSNGQQSEAGDIKGASVHPTVEISDNEVALSLPQTRGAETDQLPNRVHTAIRPNPGWRHLGLAELWRCRELLLVLTLRDIKARYKQTFLGAAWAALQPLATMAAFVLFLGRVAGAQDPTKPYPLFVFAGLIPWMFFAAALNGAGNSVISNQHLVTKVYFPRLLVPLGAVAAALLDFLIAFSMLLLLMPFYGSAPRLSLIVAPLVLLVLLMLVIGLGALLAALTVAYRDFKAIVPLALQLWMFGTPAIYLQESIAYGTRMRAWLLLNPMQGVIVNFRAAVLGGPFDVPAACVCTGWAVVLLLAGCLFFRRVERSFADII
jgi:lipopolysaccharide transport system permease protein